MCLNDGYSNRRDESMHKYHLSLYILFCLIGAGLEWCYGTFWSLVGTTPWIYSNSPLHYTSLEGLPLWGFGGLLIVSVYEFVMKRRAKLLLGVVAPLLLGVLWVLIHTQFIA